MELLITTEIVTAILFIGLAIIIGYRGNKLTGALLFALFAAFVSSVFIVTMPLLFFYLVDDVSVWLGPLGQATFILVGMATLLGYPGNQVGGAVLLGLGAVLASIICTLATLLGYVFLGGSAGASTGLLAGILLAGIFVARLLGKLIRGRSTRFLTGVWFGFCALCVCGYMAGGIVGLNTITLPAIALFWMGLYRIAGYVLPLHNKRDKQERLQAFRCLITFNMGTNYPYYFLDEDGKLDKRVDGNAFLQFFAGPGIVYTGCDHAAYVTDGVSRNRVFDPGLSFTSMYDLAPRLIDLRPQLRAFPVEARTQDGIPIKVLTFIPFRIDSEGQQAALGRHFPYSSQAVHNAMAGELVEKKQRKEESGEKHEWDGRLIPTIASRIVQDIISRYTVNGLCAPLNPNRDPRVKIATEMRKRVTEALLPLGLELVGGGISNLMPQDSAVIARRLDSWRTKWERMILRLITESEIHRKGQIETARVEAETEIVYKFGQIISETVRSGDISQTALALRFVDCLGEIVSESDGQWPLPKDFESTLKRLRGEIEAGER